MVHRIVQFGLASLLTTTLAFGTAFAQDEGGGEEPAGDPSAEPAEGEGEAGGEEAGGGMEEGGGGGEMAAEAPKQLRFGIAGVFALPLGDFADVAGIGIGILGGITYALSPKLALAGHVGLVYHLPKNDFTVMEIPILAGVRYMVIPKLAIGADTGINILRTSFDAPEGVEVDAQTDTRIPLGLHVGYMIGSNLSVGAGLFIPNLLLTEEGEDTQLELFGFVGYMF